MGSLWVETPEPALISCKRLNYSLTLNLILLNIVYVAKTHWHGTFLNIRRLRLLLVTTSREDSCIPWLGKGREGRQPCEICLPLTPHCVSRCCHWMSLWHIPSRNLPVWLTPAQMRCGMCKRELRSPAEAFPLSFPGLHLLPQRQLLFTDLRGGTETTCIFHIFNISFSFLAVVGSTIPTHHCCYFRELFYD